MHLYCIYLFWILLYLYNLYTWMHLFVLYTHILQVYCTLMHLYASICSSQSNSMHSVLIYMRQAGSSSYHRFTLMGELWGIIYTYTLMGNHIQLCTYTLMWHHIQCNKLKPQHSLVQCTLCMWYMHVPPPDTTDSHLWSYCVCVEVSILGPI